MESNFFQMLSFTFTKAFIWSKFLNSALVVTDKKMMIKNELFCYSPNS